MKLILILVSIIKKIQVDKNGKQYILFRIDIFFTKYCLAVEIDEKGHTNRDLEFEEKDKRHEKKNVTVHLLEFKNKELEDEIEKLKLQLANLSIQNNDVNNIDQHWYNKMNNKLNIK